jgi:hypothetical protein
MNDVTRVLNAIEQGDPHAAGQLLPLGYDELRSLAVLPRLAISTSVAGSDYGPVHGIHGELADLN